MHTEAKLVGELRKKLGSIASRQLRRQGRVPGNLYGHNQEPVPFSVTAESLMPVVRSRARVLDLDLGDKAEKAVLQEIQWDTFGQNIQHIDLLRVDPNERVTVHVPVEFKGTAPGVLAGGILEQTLRTLTIECLAHEIPDNIVVRIQNLDVNQAIHVREVELPPNMKVLENPDLVVVHVVKVEVGDVGPQETTEQAMQPELIRRPAEEEEE